MAEVALKFGHVMFTNVPKRRLVALPFIIWLVAGSPVPSGQLFPCRDASAQEWLESIDGRRREIVRRYQAILERRPVEGTVFDRLMQEVGSGRAFQQLLADYEGRVIESPNDYALHMILGHLYKRAQRFDVAATAYGRASEIEPGEALPVQSWADSLYNSGRIDEARQAYERALEMTRDRRDREDILFALADISFSSRDFGAAAAYFERIVELNPRDVYIRQQLAETLVEYQRFDDAIAQFQAIVEMSGTDTRQRAMSMAAIGDIYSEMGNLEDAIAKYREAQGLTRRNSWLYEDLEYRVIDAFRASGNLPALIEEYEDQWQRPNFDQMRILTELYQEMGRFDDALAMARRGVDLNRRDVDARLALIELLERLGDWDEVIANYETLLDFSDEPQHTFRLARIHRQLGHQTDAFTVMEAAERRYRNNATVLSRIADVYLRWGERERALELYESVVSIEPDNPDYRIALGQFYFMQGRRDDAMASWQTILEIVDDSAEAQSMLAQVYADHGLVDDALVLLESAIAEAPDREYQRVAMAEILQEARRYNQALEIWEALASESSDPELRADARRQVINVLHHQGVLTDRLGIYTRRLNDDPPDLAAGYLLGEAYLRLEDYDAAEWVFLVLLENEDESVTALSSLATVYREQGRLSDAVGLLIQLGEIDPGQQQRYHRDIVDLALRTFDEDLAVEYASLGVELNPNDARAYGQLGDVYRRVGQLERALNAYQEAIRLDRRDYQYMFAAAELAATLSQIAEADGLYRTIVRNSRSGAEIGRAGRRAVELNEVQGTLPSLLDDWQTLPQRPELATVTNRLVLSLYERLLDPIETALAHGAADQIESASSALLDLRERASTTAPLFVDPNALVRAESLRLLVRLGAAANLESAARLLLDEDERVRAEAALVLGALADGSQQGSLVEAAADPAPIVRALTAWALGVAGDEGQSALVGLLTNDDTVSVRALATVALAVASQRSGSDVGSDSAIVELLRQRMSDGTGADSLAATWALGGLAVDGARDELEVMLEHANPRFINVAAWALSRLPPATSTYEALLRCHWGADSAAWDACGAAFVVLATDGERPIPTGDPSDFWDRRTALINVGDYIVSLGDLAADETQPVGASFADQHLETIALVADQLLGRAGSEQSRTVLSLSGGEPVGLGGLVRGTPLSASAVLRLAEVVAGHADALLASDDPDVRRATLQILGAAGDAAPIALLEAALSDSVLEVRYAAAVAIGRSGARDLMSLLEELAESRDCVLRSGAARALGELGGPAEVLAPLLSSADVRCDLVRASAAWGIALSGSPRAVDQLEAALAAADEAMRVELALALRQIGDDAATEVLSRLASDSSALVREAALP